MVEAQYSKGWLIQELVLGLVIRLGLRTGLWKKLGSELRLLCYTALADLQNSKPESKISKQTTSSVVYKDSEYFLNGKCPQ